MPRSVGKLMQLKHRNSPLMLLRFDKLEKLRRRPLNDFESATTPALSPRDCRSWNSRRDLVLHAPIVTSLHPHHQQRRIQGVGLGAGRRDHRHRGAPVGERPARVRGSMMCVYRSPVRRAKVAIVARRAEPRDYRAARPSPTCRRSHQPASTPIRHGFAVAPDANRGDLAADLDHHIGKAESSCSCFDNQVNRIAVARSTTDQPPSAVDLLLHAAADQARTSTVARNRPAWSASASSSSAGGVNAAPRAALLRIAPKVPQPQQRAAPSHQARRPSRGSNASDFVDDPRRIAPTQETTRPPAPD